MFGSTPPIVKNLLIINVLMLLLTYGVGSQMGIDLSEYLGLHHWSSDRFNPIQFVTYLFMHGNQMHLLFNMFAVWMFGRVLEQVWGAKRFLIYYFITGIGAGIIQLIVMTFSLSDIELVVSQFQQAPSLAGFKELFTSTRGILNSAQEHEIVNFVNNSWILNPDNTSYISKSVTYSDWILKGFQNIGTVGASGSVFGILLAFGMLFPNTQLMLLFPPIPIKAKYLVIGYGVIELFAGIANRADDNVAHFAHLGGMLFGFILIKYWKKSTNSFY